VSTSRRIRHCAIAALLVAGAGAASAAVGARVLVQQWDPRQPDAQGVHPLVDDPDVVSRSIAQAWATGREQICKALKAKLGTRGLAKGQSLYDIDCRLDPNAAFSVESAATNLLQVRFAIRGNSVTATSTVPDPLPKALDPRFSLTLDASLTVKLAVQADPNNTLRAIETRFALASAKLDSHNASGDAIKFVVDDLIPFFGGPNFKQMAEAAINGVSTDLASTFNGAMAPVNAKLRGPSEAVRVGVWGRPDRITVAFAPRELSPPGGGAAAGALRWDPAQYRPKDCSSFQLQASVQTGPAPLLNPDNHSVVGVAPRRKVGRASLAPAGEHECRWAMTNLPQGWPARIETQVDGVARLKTGGNTFFKRHVALVPDGWSGTLVANAANRNYTVAESTSPNAVAQQRTMVKDPLGPVAKPLVRNVNPADAVALNPQPLPPKTPNVATTLPNAGGKPSAATSVLQQRDAAKTTESALQRRTSP
jgi:hypothetical protein